MTSLLERLRSGVTDIIETEDQKALRQASERELAARPLRDRGLPVGLNLISEIAGGVPSTVEAVRQAGMSFGMPLQTDSEMMEQAFANFEDTPEGRARTINAVKAIDPIRAAGLVDIFQQRDREAELREQADADRLQQRELTDQQIATSAAQEQEILASAKRTGELTDLDKRNLKRLEDIYGIEKATYDASTAERKLEMDTASMAITSAFEAIKQLPGGEIFADTFQSSFPLTYDGMEQARNLYFELSKPEEIERDRFVDTIVDMAPTLPSGEPNPTYGMPLRVVFDKLDPEYSAILGPDKEVLETIGVNGRLGSMRADAGVAIPTESFDATQMAQRLIGLAFTPDLDTVVGPYDLSGQVSRIPVLGPATVATANLMTLNPYALQSAARQAELVDEISRTQTQGILPFIRLLAPVTETDVEILKGLELGLRDEQHVWMRKTMQEKMPQLLNTMYGALEKEGQAFGGVQRVAMHIAAQAYDAVALNPQTKIFDSGKYSTADALRDARALLPDARQITVSEFSEPIYNWKGKAVNHTLMQQIANNKNYDIDFNKVSRDNFERLPEEEQNKLMGKLNNFLNKENIVLIQR